MESRKWLPHFECLQCYCASTHNAPTEDWLRGTTVESRCFDKPHSSALFDFSLQHNALITHLTVPHALANTFADAISHTLLRAVQFQKRFAATHFNDPDVPA